MHSIQVSSVEAQYTNLKLFSISQSSYNDHWIICLSTMSIKNISEPISIMIVFKQCLF